MKRVCIAAAAAALVVLAVVVVVVVGYQDGERENGDKED